MITSTLVEMAGSHIQGDSATHLAAFHGKRQETKGFLFTGQLGAKTTLIPHKSALVPTLVQNSAQGVVNRNNLLQCLRVTGGLRWLEEKILEVEILSRMQTTTDHVDHGHGKAGDFVLIQMLPKGNPNDFGRRPRTSHRYREDRIRPQLGFVFRTIHIDHLSIDLFLVGAIHPHQIPGNYVADVADGLQHTLALIAFWIAVPKFQCLESSRAGPRGNAGHSHVA